MTRAPWMRVARWVAVVVVVALVAWRIAGQWADVRATLATVQLDPRYAAASAAAVLTSYAVLIWTWQQTVRAWGERLAFGPAARIWFVSNLGRYVPGKVWQIAAMGVMAQEAGVAPAAAIGSSLVIALVNVVVGVAIAVALGAGDVVAPGLAVPATVAMAAAVVAIPWGLPALGRLVSRVLRRPIVVPPLPHRAIWIAAAGCAAAWMLYGAAFRWLHVALLGVPTGTWQGSTAAFIGSYLVGFLALFAPGGIGVRELTLEPLLVRFGIASGAAAAIVIVVSRLWLTVLEVLPGLVLLVVARRGPRPSSPT